MTDTNQESQVVRGEDEELRSSLGRLGIGDDLATMLLGIGPAKLQAATRLIRESLGVSKEEAVQAPMIGLFYDRLSPDSEPFAEIGDIVQPGQTIGRMEAMKVFMEIPYQGTSPARLIDRLHNNALAQQGDQLACFEPIE